MKKKMVIGAVCLCIMAMVSGCGKKSEWAKYVTLGDYKGIEVTKQDVEVEDAEIEAQMANVIAQNSTYQKITEGTVKSGDVVNISYEGKKDGVAFEGGTSDDYDLEIGSGQFIDGFEDGLIGVKVGATVDIDVTFPADYGQADLAGKPVVFTVTVKSIQGDPIVPEWTDEFVQSISDDATLVEYKENLKTSMLESKKKQVTTNQEYELMDKIVKNCDIKEYPEDKVTEYIRRMKENFTQQATSYGTDYTSFIQGYFGMDEETFNQELDKAAKNVTAQNMIVTMIAEKEKIKYDEKTLETDSLAYVKEFGYETVEDFEKAYGANSVKDDLLRRKVLEFLMSSAVQVEPTVTPAPTEVPTDGAADANGTPTEVPTGSSIDANGSTPSEEPTATPVE